MPNGYTEWFKISLVGVDEGSALPDLVLEVEEPEQAEIDNDFTRKSLMQKAELEFYKTLKLASEGEAVTLSPAQIRNFNRFLPNLKQDESFFCAEQRSDLELMNSNVISIDIIKRNNFLKNIKSTYEQRVQGNAFLKSVDYKGSIKFQSKELGEFSLNDSSKDPSEYGAKIGSYYHFDLTVERRHDDLVQEVKLIHELTPLDHPLFSIIDSFSTLEDGWLDGYGKSINPELIQKSKDFIKFRKADLPEFYAIAPTEEGNILLEYRDGSWDYGIEFKNESIILFGIDVDSDDEMSKEYDSFENSDFLWDFDKSFKK